MTQSHTPGPLGTTDNRCNWCGQPVNAEQLNADLLHQLHMAVVRVELANREGDPILSAWLPGARAAIAKATYEKEQVKP